MTVLGEAEEAVALGDAQPVAEPGARGAADTGGPPTAARRPGLVRAVVLPGLAIVGGFVLAFAAFLLVLSGTEQARAQRGLERRFADELARGRAPVGGAIRDGQPVALLEIPPLRLRQVVVQGTRSRELRKAPGHLPGTVLPGQAGVTVILGRRQSFGSPFDRIGSLRRGDEVRLTTGQGTARYRVQRIERLGRSADRLTGSSTANAVRLVTLSGLGPGAGRLVVTATLVGPPGATPAVAGAPTRRDDGLHGERAALAPVLLWLEVLLLVVLATTWIYRRWYLWPTYLLTTPVIIVVTWLLFDELARLLPATW